MTLLTLNACRKTEEEATPEKDPRSLSCSIDGESYVAKSFAVMVWGGNKLQISGRNTGTTQSVVVWLIEPVQTGTYSLSSTGDYKGEYVPLSATTSYTSSSGTVIVSEYDTSTGKIKGSFNFEATDGTKTVSIKDGQFEVFNK